jgi:Ca2+/H+ antiporter, TMEM165/GDT1 family
MLSCHTVPFRPEGAAWAAAPLIRTLGVRLLYIFLVAFILIMVGELADKSQLLALLLATRYKAWQVLIGIFIATFVVHFFTALAGQLLGSAIPQNAIPWMTGVLFIGFGIWTLRGDKVEDSEADKGGRFGPIIATTIAFFLAELGDKTQIMTLAIAVDPGSAILVYLKGAGPTVQGWLATVGSPANVSAMGRFWAVTLGSTVGMVVADAVAILIGRLLGKNLPELLMRRVSGVIFILFGVLSIGSVLLGG